MAEPRVQVIVEAVDRASGTLNRVGQNLNTSLRRVSMGLLLVGGTVTAFSTLAVKAAIDQRIAVDRVRGAMEALGDSYEARRENIGDLIDRVGELTAFSKAQLTETFGVLVNATGSLETAAKVLPAAAVLAKATGLELGAAADLVVAAITGDKGALAALRKLGVDVSDPSNPFQVLTDIQKRFQKQAQDSITAIDKFKLTFSDFRVAVGNAVIPVLEDIFAALDPVIKAFGKLVTDHPAIAAAASGIGAALLVLAGSITAVRLGLLAVGPIFAVLAGLAALAASPIAVAISLVVGAIAILVGIAFFLRQHWDTIWGWMREHTNLSALIIGTALGPIGLGLAGLAIGLMEVWRHWDDIWGWITDKVQGAKDKLLGFLGGIRDAFMWIIDHLSSVFLPAWNAIWGAIEAVAGTVAQGINVALQPIIAVVNSLLALLAWIETRLGRPSPPPPSNVPKPKPVPRFQHGGVTSGGLALVGESGPELAMFPGGTRITPLNRAGGALSITVAINGPVYGLSDLDRHIVETIRRAIDGGGFYQTILSAGRR